jgi:hypothetical protein
MTSLRMLWQKLISSAVFPIAGTPTHVHDGQDLQFIIPDPENERIREDIEAALAQVAFETTVDSRIRHHAGFRILPFFEEPNLEIFLLCSIPCGGFKAFLTCRAAIVHSHDLKVRAKALVDFFPDPIRWNELLLVRVDVAGATP